MYKNLIYSLLVLVVASTAALSQDLNTLRGRASQLWAERLQRNKSKAADFIEKEGRSDFPMYENVREATVTGLEFTPDKSKIRVTAKTKAFFPMIGNVDQPVTESWVWKSGNWFVHLEPATADPFQVPGVTSAITGHQAFTFQLVDKKIDLGAHQQGDKINGTVKFAASRSMLQSIRARGMGGFRIVGTRWIDDKNGEFDFILDSSLIYKDIDESVVLEAIGPERAFEISSVTENLTLVGRIEGKIRISQLPQSPGNEKDRFVELEIENVGKATFSLEGIRSLDGNFSASADDVLPPPLAPGQTAKVMVTYPTQARLVDGELMIQLSAGVLPSDRVLFRIKGAATQRAEQPPAALDRSTIDAAVRKALQDAQRNGLPQ